MDASADRLTVSVALCTYNGEAFLQEQLDSIAAQTRLPDELVIGDDASTDTTMALVERFRETVPFPVQVIARTINVGTTANFSQTTQATSGDLVFLSDQDDRWSRHKIERMLEQFRTRRELLALHTNARLVDAAGAPLGMDLFTAYEVTTEERGQLRAGLAFDALIRRNLATGATMAVRRDLLRLAMPAPAAWVHDEWLAIVAAALGPATVDVLDDALIDYRQHDRNQIGARRPSLHEKIAKAFDKPGDYYAKQLDRATVLLERLVSLGPAVAAGRVDQVRDKLAHLRAREGLPASRLARLRPIAREYFAGSYRRYSTGTKSLVRDLLHRC